MQTKNGFDVKQPFTLLRIYWTLLQRQAKENVEKEEEQTVTQKAFAMANCNGE